MAGTTPETQALPSSESQDQSQDNNNEQEVRTTESGSKRRRSNSLEAEAAAEALTQLDGPSHTRQSYPHSGFQPTLGATPQMHPSQYANAFSAGQNTDSPQSRYSGTLQQDQHAPYHAPDMNPNGPHVAQSPSSRASPGNPHQATPPVGPSSESRNSGTHPTRQRTAVACRYCRKRKIRCTGMSPNPNDDRRCSNCRRLDQECVYMPVGAPPDNYARHPGPDQFGRFQPMIQPGLQGPQCQGYPPPVPYPPYGLGRGVPGPDGPMHYMPGPPAPFPQPQGYPPQGQQYQYYPNFVNDPNVGGPQAQFGRLKPETYAVFPSSAVTQASNPASTAQPSGTEPAEVQAPAPEASVDQSVKEVPDPPATNTDRPVAASNGNQEQPAMEQANPAAVAAPTDVLSTTNGAAEISSALSESVIEHNKATPPRNNADDGLIATLLNPQPGENESDKTEEEHIAKKQKV